MVVISGIAIVETPALATPENCEALSVKPCCPTKQRARLLRRQKTAKKQTCSRSHECMGAPKQRQHDRQTDTVPEAFHSRPSTTLSAGLAGPSRIGSISVASATGLQETAKFFVVSGHDDPSRSRTGRASADRPCWRSAGSPCARSCLGCLLSSGVQLCRSPPQSVATPLHPI